MSAEFIEKIMSYFRKVYFFLVFVVASWSLAVVGISLFSEEKILFFPWPQFMGNEFTSDRLEVLRLSLFLLGGYFGLIHVSFPEAKFSAGHVLVSIMTSITLVGTFKLLLTDRFPNDAIFIIAFAFLGMVIILGSRPVVRRYFAD